MATSPKFNTQATPSSDVESKFQSLEEKIKSLEAVKIKREGSYGKFLEGSQLTNSFFSFITSSGHVRRGNADRAMLSLVLAMNAAARNAINIIREQINMDGQEKELRQEEQGLRIKLTGMGFDVDAELEKRKNERMGKASPAQSGSSAPKSSLTGPSVAGV